MQILIDIIQTLGFVAFAYIIWTTHNKEIKSINERLKEIENKTKDLIADN